MAVSSQRTIIAKGFPEIFVIFANIMDKKKQPPGACTA